MSSRSAMPKSKRQHVEMMKEMPDMKHAEGNAVSLEPGETQELIWQFSHPARSRSRVICRSITKPACAP